MDNDANGHGKNRESGKESRQDGRKAIDNDRRVNLGQPTVTSLSDSINRIIFK